MSLIFLYLVSSLLMMSTITCTSQLQVVFNTTELKLSHLSQPRSRPKLDSQRLMLCLLQVSDTSTKSEPKSITSLNLEFKLTILLVRQVSHFPPLFKKLRFSTVLPKASKTLLQQVNFNLSTAESPT